MRVVVTGASSRIGQAIVRLLGAEGHYVIALYRSRRERVLEALGGSKGEIHQLDLRDENAIQAFATKVGEIDALVNNAGILAKGLEVVHVNLIGTIRLTEALMPKMALRSSIVFIGDALADGGMRDYPHYAASKAGLKAYALSLAKLLAPRVRVNVVEPGIIKTDLLESDARLEGKFRKAVPLGRLGSPTDVARVVLFVLQEEYLNGCILRVDGGLAITNLANI